MDIVSIQRLLGHEKEELFSHTGEPVSLATQALDRV
jgi:hypothetical protein